jgi:1-aminocyclopropane-1-carboxylate deaminase/D-cysteine desulfhydrase-like pyridoxal-dependent ACC family enzyme
VNTNYATYLEVKENNSVKCSTEYHFEQYGLYHLSLENCTISVQVGILLDSYCVYKYIDVEKPKSPFCLVGRKSRFR